MSGRKPTRTGSKDVPFSFLRVCINPRGPGLPLATQQISKGWLQTPPTFSFPSLSSSSFSSFDLLGSVPHPTPPPHPPPLNKSHPACQMSTEGTKPPASGPLAFQWGALTHPKKCFLLLEIQASGQAVGDKTLKHSTSCLMQRQCMGGEAPRNTSGSRCQPVGMYRITRTLPQTLMLSAHSHRTYPPLIYSNSCCLAYPSHLLS